MGSGLPDAWWFRPDGRRMTRRDWEQPECHALGVFLNGREIGRRTPEGEPMTDESFLLFLNADADAVDFRVPARRFGRSWQLELTTDTQDARPFRPGETLRLAGRSLVVLQRVA